MVTGASRGIGRALALAFAREGASVALMARSEGDLKSLQMELRSIGCPTLALPMDVTKETDVRDAFVRARDELGRVDILFNGAGVGFHVPVQDMSLEAWDTTMAVNLRGTFLCCRAVLPGMIARKAGSIINVASAERGYPNLAAYNASKHGVVAFTQALAEEVRSHGIAVNCVRFGVVVDTAVARALHPGYDGKGWQKPEDVTDILVLLATQDAAGVTGGYINTYEWQKQIRGPVSDAVTHPPQSLISGPPR